ncbi:hypothetical protein ACFY2R_29665, partial [Micromonospora olivasterospora]
WRPRDGGPTTLREYLETLELPTGVSLNTDRQGRLTPGMTDWMKAWALGLQNETTLTATPTPRMWRRHCCRHHPKRVKALSAE